MTQQGFEYDPVDFLDEPWPDTFSSQFFLDYDGLGVVGYRALYRVLARNFGSSGAPARPSFEESSTWTNAQRVSHLEMLEQYAIALSGEEFIASLEHETDTRVPIAGCRGEGSKVVEGLTMIDPLPGWLEGDGLADASERVQASDEYVQFFGEWQECMSKAGYEMTTAAYRPILFEVRGRFDVQLAELARNEPERFAEIAAAADPGSQSLDSEWLIDLVAIDPLLLEMYESEIGQALEDAKCRAESDTSLRESVAAIELELGFS